MRCKLLNRCKNHHQLRLNKLINYILRDENAVYYECGYSCDNQVFISLGSERFFITDGRYEIDAKLNIKNCKIIITKDLTKSARKILKRSQIKKIFFDPHDFSMATYLSLTKKLDIKFIQKLNFSKLKRIIKTDDEIKLIQKAMQIGRNGFREFKSFLDKNGQGKSELYLNYMASGIMSHQGKYNLSFKPITAIDKNSAKPHAMPKKTKLKKNSLFLHDAGVKYKRYCSDRTVTYINKKDKLQQKIYDLVLKAHNKAISKARVGMRASKVDKIARDVIEESGYGKYFVHSTGHGVGLDIHEYPNISSKSDIVIEENMVFTIEPGIYLPDKFGIRIEDTVAMLNGKATIL